MTPRERRALAEERAAIRRADERVNYYHTGAYRSLGVYMRVVEPEPMDEARYHCAEAACALPQERE